MNSIVLLLLSLLMNKLLRTNTLIFKSKFQYNKYQYMIMKSSSSSSTTTTTSSSSSSSSSSELYKSKKNTIKEFILSGEDAYKRLIQRANFYDTPLKNSLDFLQWAREIVKRKYLNDQEFTGRVLVRDLRKANIDILHEVESSLVKAKNDFESNRNSVIIYELDRLIHGAEQAITSMQKFIETVSDNVKITDKKKVIAITLPLKKEEHLKNIQYREEKRRETPEYEIYQNAIKRVEDTYEEIGLNVAIQKATILSTRGGDGRNSRGKNFEARARLLLEELLVPTIADKYGYDKNEVFIVQNVKLGMASIKGTCSELDCMICVRSERPTSIDVKPKGTFVKVLAIIEVKRNPDDIGEAFAGYQQSLSWLSGIRQAYDPEVWKTKAYPTGHFRSFMQEFYGEMLLFTCESFEHIKPRKLKVNKNVYFTELQRNYDTNNSIDNDDNSDNDNKNDNNNDNRDSNDNNDVYLFLDCLYFVTKDGTVECMNSKCSAWAINKIATEESFDQYLTDTDAVEKLRLRAIDRYAHRLSTIDICNLYSHCNVNGIYVIGYEKDNDNIDEKDNDNDNING